jgi:nitrate/TMAO reductase-like tetraheme cytochrome c subunit
VFTLGYARGLSHLSTDPRACVNCHIMNDQVARILAEVIDYARQSQREAVRTARRDESETTSIWEAVR